MEKLRTSIGVFWINTVCTLKCKKCITLTPYHRHAMSFPKEQIFADTHAFFEIYDWVEHFDIEGGESLLHPDLPQIVENTFLYKEHFGRFHILTNGTVLPSRALIDSCKKCGNVFFIIDDYGPELSCKRAEIEDILKNNGITYRVDTYWGNQQYYGGWVDFGDMRRKQYTEEQEKIVFESCRQAHCGAPYIKNGKMYLCSIQAAGIEYITLQPDEYVDLHEISLEEKIKRAAALGQRPVSTCAYCKGFDVEHAQRYPAAEQITAPITEEEKICL